MASSNSREKTKISRRDFLRAAGLALGGSAQGSLGFLSGCRRTGEISTSTITETVTYPATSLVITKDTTTATGVTANTASYSTTQLTAPLQMTVATVTTSAPSTTLPLAVVDFPGTVILGRPEDNSITLSLLTDNSGEIYCRCGQISGKYDSQTPVQVLTKDQPLELTISGLNKDMQYYYVICHRLAGGANFCSGSESAFHTKRSAGSSFIFTVDADPHWDENADPEIIKLTFQNTRSESPDFNIDLGDTPFVDKATYVGATMAPKAPSTYETVAAVSSDRRNYFNIFGRSTPLFLVLGNHDGEQGSALNGTENNLAIWSTKARKLYYPNPLPDGFYSGSSKEETIVGLRGNYYAWEWGDGLFVVLDPFWYTRPAKNPATGWDWTLGKDQYNWLKTTLEKSQVKYKFVFCHNLVGGFDPSSNKNMAAGAGNGRGGSEAARFYEWGGLNTDGTPGFDQNRPGWGKPIHQLLVENGVTIFFHGHDHFFAKQQLGGVIYQECPQPGSINNSSHVAEYGYVDGMFLGSSGHIRVKVSSEATTVDYIRTYLPKEETPGHKNGEVAYSYSVTSAL